MPPQGGTLVSVGRPGTMGVCLAFGTGQGSYRNSTFPFFRERYLILNNHLTEKLGNGRKGGLSIILTPPGLRTPHIVHLPKVLENTLVFLLVFIASLFFFFF